MPDPEQPGPVASEAALADAALAFSEQRAGDLSDTELLHVSELAHRHERAGLAIQAMEELLRRYPLESAWHLRLARLHLSAGDAGAARGHCQTAVDLAPADRQGHELLAHIGVALGDLEGTLEALDRQEKQCSPGEALRLQRAEILFRLGRLDEALREAQRINDLGPPSEASLLLEAELAYRLGEADRATLAADRACRLWPDSPDANLKLAVLLCEQKLYARAMVAIDRARTLAPGNARLAHLKCVASMALGRHPDARAAILEAVQLAPQECEYLYLAALLCEAAGQRAEALDWLDKAIAACPDRTALHVARAHLLANDGAFSPAIVALDVARKLDPSNQEIRDFRLALLAQRQGSPVLALAGSGSRAVPALPRAARSRRPPGEQGLLDRLRVQGRVIAALVRRDFRYRALHSRFGVLSVMIPQAIQIVTLGVVLSLFNNGRPPIGDHLFFFYATGVMPFYLFIHIMDHSQNQFLDNIGLLQIPVVTRLDVVLAMAISELMINVATIVVTFCAFALMDYGPPSDNQIEAVWAILVVWLFAFGLGLISAVMNNLYRPWANGWLILQRFLYISSGVFYIPSNMPDWIRDGLVWNPVLQAIEWFRTGFFIGYDPPWLDKPYLMGIAFATVLAGLMLERALRRRMRTQ
jgi:capsular polysaccharide transport system permease protein